MNTHGSAINDIQSKVQEAIQLQKSYFTTGYNSRNFCSEKEFSISTRAMNQVLFFDPDDMVVGVEAGMRFADLQNLLNEAKMELSVDAWYQNASVGGIVASNTFGPRRMFTGGIRDSIIGLEYINGYGDRVKSGGKVVKNVTGYDLGRMMIGSMGYLGTITSVNFKVTPLPIDPAILNVILNDEQLIICLTQLLELKIAIDSLQVIYHSGQSWKLDIGISGNSERQNRIRSDIEKIIPGKISYNNQKENNSAVTLNNQSAFIESFQKNLYQSFADLHLNVKLCTKTILSIDFIKSLKIGGADIILHPFGADIHFFWNVTSITEQEKLIQSILNQFSEKGFTTIERCLPSIRKSFLFANPVPKQFKALKFLKKQCDPKTIFNSILCS